ncbi:Peptidase aspartic, catalytic [Cordyceps fumosorosea ARSEF 2679]|uniref:Peptidase aspartic, catalytic n=1 Tax=Cordyceps fumosorosea (strain ARSEF 2679) TaxID=1081104 RepID=A0A162JH88_CORFA|nr:Peptidase aspartic, catalytic [Cordyceps fumosorosea ARSEF 2679]OAA68952.1 Peptidase aspartic, catalytic [Cordyceps fumosorosea ARSEF 2679]
MAAVASVAATTGVANAYAPAAVSIPHGDWLGIDGNWSSVSFLLGTESDPVNIIPSTSLSELWAVGPGGCQSKEPHCPTARGGIYTPANSKRWTSWGQYFLGLEYLGYGGNGAYGLDNINSWSPFTNIAFGMSDVLIAAYNTTDYFTGLFGLGISQGRFKGNIGESALTQAVKTFGWIPSYSYGYTAGASYKNMPGSLTLGGFDGARLVEHDTLFTITQSDNSPRVNVRGISVDNSLKPNGWGSSVNILSTYNDTFMALVDSTTPYLWLPESTCESFAAAFNLTYNETFKLYTMTNDQYQDYSSSNAYTFTFSLASIDNNDNFGLPLSAPGVVNITLPIKSFVGSLQYPFANQAIKYGQPAVPYFMLRKAASGNNTIIGRSFLQEAYIRTKYDSGVFSLHQAAFPKDPYHDIRLAPIKQPSDSPYPRPPPTNGHHGLTTPQMIGVAVGVVAFCTLLVAALCFWGRRRKQKKRGEAASKEVEAQDSSSTIAPDSPMTPVSRILSKIGRRKRSRRATTTTETSAPTEVPASEIYELPAPLPPAELAAHDDDDSILGDTEAGTDDSQNLSAYEVARRKLARQLAGPVPAYAPPADGVLPVEKDMHIDTDVVRTTTIPHPRPTYHYHNVSPVRSHEGLGTNSLPGTLPSPVSPRTDWNTNDLPSPITASLHPNSASSRSGSTGRRRAGSNTMNGTSSESGSASRSNSNSSSHSHDQQQRRDNVSFPLPQASFQRTPIEPSKVVCLGPLPENVSLFRQNMMSNATGTNGQSWTGQARHTPNRPSTGSLGSNFTDEEDAMVEEITRQSIMSASRSQDSANINRRPTVSHPIIRTVLPAPTEEEENISPTSDRSGSGSQSSGGRIGGDDLVHVPQLAEKRYSWEEER